MKKEIQIRNLDNFLLEVFLFCLYECLLEVFL